MQQCIGFYRPQISWGKVMFLHMSVILFTGGVCLSACWDTPPGPDPLGSAQAPPIAVHAGTYGQQAGGTHPTGMHSCLAKCLPKLYENERIWTEIPWCSFGSATVLVGGQHSMAML